MTLQPGTRLGPYEINAPIGAGGMGEVYRGRDTRLDRSVAIKVLPAEYAANPQLRARLEREARSISSLNHPNVCTLYDVGSENGTDYLVMELLEGETLADRIARGALPLPEALRHAIDIAGALDKAHRHGIVHRDLKPGNVMLTREGAKLLDFGLSKPAASISEAISADTATRQMSSRPLTAEGMIVGTFQYMAPEQVEGGDADARTDIFAFGALLYEMLTGKRAFDGKSRTSMIAQILEREPPSVSAVQPMTPRSLDRIVRACLAKNPNDRFQTAHDLMLELRWTQEELSLPQAEPVRRRSSRVLTALPWLVLALAALAGGWFFATRDRAEDARRPIRASIVSATKTNFLTSGDYAGAVALSRDGRQVAWVAVGEDGRRHVWVRAVDASEARRLDGTTGAIFPFWSPDGKTVGFFADAFMKTIDLAGGPATTVCKAVDPRGATWSENGEIVFAPVTRAGLSRVRASGGEPQTLTTVKPIHSTHRWPLFLPDGKRFLYLAAHHGQPNSDETAIYLGSLDGKENRLLVKTLGSVAIAAGHLLFVRDTTLFAQPFDAEKATLSGEPVPIVRGVSVDASTWRAIFDAVDDDLLVYQAGSNVYGGRLTLHDPAGNRILEYPGVAPYGDLVATADGKSIITNIGDPNSNHWLIDVESGTRTRLTFERGFERSPVLTADQTEVFYSSTAGTRYSRIYRKALNGAPRIMVAEDPDADLVLNGVTPDKKWIVALRLGPPRASFEAFPVGAGNRRTVLIPEGSAFFNANLSPQGDLLVYENIEESGEHLYMTTFPETDAKWQISGQGGRRPVWSTDGKTLYYIAAQDQLVAVPITRTAQGVAVGRVRNLFRTAGLNPMPSQPYCVLPDGKVVVNTIELSTEPLTLLTNWTAALRQNVPR